MPKTKESDTLKPAYCAWKSLKNFLARWKADTHVPHTIDNSVMPSTMASALRWEVMSALKFLGLTDGNGVVREGFGALVEAHGTDSWKVAVKEYVLPAYDDIIADLPLENATAAQLDNAFKANGNVDGQMLQKCVRFYLHALADSDVKYSSLFTMRKERSPRKKSSRKKSDAKKETNSSDEQKPNGDDLPKPGTQRYPLYFKGKAEGSLVVPEDLSAADCNVIELQLAVLKAYAGVAGK